MSELPYEYKVRVIPYSDGSGYAAEAVIEPGDDGQPSVQIKIVYRINAEGWSDLKEAIDSAMSLALRASTKAA